MARFHRKGVPTGRDPADFPRVPFTAEEEAVADAQLAETKIRWDAYVADAPNRKALRKRKRGTFNDDGTVNKAGYGSFGDQLDQLFHDMTAGKGDKTGEWYKSVSKVKTDHPKPE